MSEFPARLTLRYAIGALVLVAVVAFVARVLETWRRLAAVLAVVVLAGCTTMPPAHLTALQAEAWACPFPGHLPGYWDADPCGDCKNRVQWLLARLPGAEPLVGYRHDAPDDLHAAVLVDGWVIDHDGVWPREAVRFDEVAYRWWY